MKYFLILALFVLTVFADQYQHYNGYKLVKALPSNKLQYEAVKKLQDEGKYDFWDELSPRGTADILLSPTEFIEVMDFFQKHEIKYTIMIEDLEKIISSQRAKVQSKPLNSMNWEDYQTFETMTEWLANLTLNNPSILTSENIGRSAEGRQLNVYKVSTGGTNKTAFWIDATIHAREWISTGSITYFINELVTNTGNYSDILDKVDFYFQPFVNPDGFVYTHEVDRNWRKTRSNTTNPLCQGADANRNFGLGFGGEGSSSNPCDITYRGPFAYSEPETLAISNYILNKTDVNWQIFITLHSYGQLWMCPFGYTEEKVDDYDELVAMSNLAVAALASVHNTSYRTGSSAEILYMSSGSSRDWAKGLGGFKWVYTVELRDTGNYGFVLPAKQLLPTAIETWAGVQELARQIINRKF